MSNYSGRDFIKASGSILGAGALGSSIFGCRKKEIPVRHPAPHRRTSSEWDGFNYAMCNESMSELSWAEQCQIVEDLLPGKSQVLLHLSFLPS